MARTIFQIEEGQIGLKVVDRAAVGYVDTWQSPGGIAVDTVTLAAYETGSAAWSCQVISGQLQATPSTTTTDVPATWCEPAETVPSPGKTSFEFVGSFLQDINMATGLNRFLFEHDTEEAYIYISWGGNNPPKAIGRVRLASGTMGGEARTNLTADFTLPMTRKPDVEFGDATTSAVVEGGEEVTVLMSTAAAAPSESESEPVPA